MKTRTIDIYDTTLRDGAQGEGVSFTSAAKLRLAERLDQFGVKYIEGGYAGSNKKDMQFFADVKKLDLDYATVVAFGSTRRAGTAVGEDPYVAGLLEADTSVVTIVGKTSALHVRDVIRSTEDENLAMITDTVRLLRARGKEVFFDAEHFFDAYKDSREFAMRALKAAADAGASALVLCDTNGGYLPHDVYGMTAAVVDAFPDLTVGIHAHNDSGVGVANALEGVRAGAGQVQGTINGYGERCGNADLIPIIAALELKCGCSCVKEGALSQLSDLSGFADDLVSFRPNPKAPYVGRSAFSHNAGLHVNAIKKNPVTFEHVTPESVGNERRILMSELSGASSVLLKAVELGVDGVKSDQNAKEILAKLKDLESRGYAFEAADASFHMLMQKVLEEHRSFFELEGFRVIIEKRGKDEACISEATVKVRVNDEIEHTVGEGDGPVNALDSALRTALTRFYPEIAKVVLTDYRVRILDPEEATAAKTRVLIESSDGQETWGTVGVSENIIEASWEALVDSVEYKLFRDEEQRAKGQDVPSDE